MCMNNSNQVLVKELKNGKEKAHALFLFSIFIGLT